MKNKRNYMLVAGVLIIAGVVFGIGREEIYSVISRMSAAQFVFMSTLQLASLLLSAFILFYLLKEKSDRVTFMDVFSLNLAGTFVESVTPSVKIGGETVKMFLMQKKTGLSYSCLAAITVINKFFSLMPFLLISLFTIIMALVFFRLPIYVYISFAGMVLFCLLFYLFFQLQKKDSRMHIRKSSDIKGEKEYSGFMAGLSKKIAAANDFLVKASEATSSIAVMPRQKILLFSASLVLWSLYPVKLLLVSRMLGFQINPFIAVLAIYCAYLVSMMPLLPGGLGTFEGMLALILTYDGLSAQEAFSIALMTRLFTFWLPLGLSAVVTTNFAFNKQLKEGA